MTFKTDVAWPKAIIDSFNASAPRTTLMERYYESYSTLLRYCFEEDSNLVLIPPRGVKPSYNFDNNADIVIYFVLCNEEGRPVIIAEITDDTLQPSTDPSDGNAHERMQRHLDDVAKVTGPSAGVSRVWGLSFVGTALTVFSRTVPVPEHDGIVQEPSKGCAHDSTPPMDAAQTDFPSNVDVLSQEAFDRLQGIRKGPA